MAGDDQTRGRHSDSVASLVATAAASFATQLAGGSATDLAGAIASSVEPVLLGSGEVLFRQGDPPDAAYFVVVGRLMVLVGAGDGATPIRRIGRGEIVGELGLLNDAPRSASVVADRDTVLARLPRNTFDRLAESNPAFARGVTGVVVGRLAHPRPPIDRISTVAVAVTAPDVDREALIRGLIAEIENHGTVVVITGDQHGANGAQSLRAAQDLDVAEAAHRFVVFDIEPAEPRWMNAAIHRADRLLVVMSSYPDEGESAQIEALTAAAASGTTEAWLVAPNGAGAAMIRNRFNPHRLLRLEPADGAAVARVARLATGMGLGLVLGGGGARGFAHLGVQRALVDLEIPVDAVAGTSIGSVFGAGIAAGFGPEEFASITAKSFRRVLDYTLPLVSMIKGRRIARSLRSIFGDRDIEDLALPLLCVSSNLTTSRPVVHERGDLVTALRASGSLPGVSPPVPSGDHLLVDGGVLNNLPVDLIRNTGMVGTVIAVDVAPPVGPGAREDYGLSLSGWKVLLDRLRPGRRRYPRLSSVMMRSIIIGSMQARDRLVAEGYADLYLDLAMRGPSLLDFEAGRSLVDSGYEAALPRIEEWWEGRDGPEREA